ncbi:MAG: NifU family protein [Anaerolineales bacterium]|nr:NifU family protein [Anaerolineales bacterium]
MVEITQTAAERLQELTRHPDYAGKALLLAVKRGPAGRQYTARFIDESARSAELLSLEAPFPIFIEAGSRELLEHASLSYASAGTSGSFRIDSAQTENADPTFSALKSAIENKINPQVRSFGGFVALLEVRDETAYIHYGASCPGCSPYVPPTIKRKLAHQLSNAVPAVSRVLDTSESAGGTNPYFRG